MSPTEINPKLKDLARLLLSFEVATGHLSETKISAAFSVSEKLRRSLSTLAGIAGFRSLIMRALTLAKREAQILNGVKVKDDGSLEGLSDEATEADAILVNHLLALLETFIGEPLTLRLLKEIWPACPVVT